MSRHARGLLKVPALLVLLTGCATTTMDQEFAEVDAAVRSRAGYDVAWAGVTADQEVVTERVQQLLNQELSADAAVQVALLNNRELQATYAEMGIEVADFISASLLPNPMADIAIRLRDPQRIIEGNVTLDILEFLLVPLRRKFQGAQLAAARLRVQAEVIDLAAETRLEYWEYVAAQHQLALAKDEAAASAAAYRMAWQLRAAGNIQALDLLQEEENFQRSKLDVAQVEMETLERRERLNALMGLWGAGTVWKAADRLPPPPDQALDLENIEARAIEASLDLSAALWQLAARSQELGIRRLTSVIPELRAGVDAEREVESDYRLVKRQTAQGNEYRLKEKKENVWWSGPTVQVEIPLFDQGQGRRAAARMEIRRRWELYNDLATDIRSAARLAAYRLEYARKRADFYNQQLVPTRHRIVLQSHLQYNAMFRGIFDLLEDKERELSTSRDYIDTLRKYWIAHTQVEQLLMGRLYDTQFGPMQNAKIGGEAGGSRDGEGMHRGRRGQGGRSEYNFGSNTGGGDE